MDTTSLRGHPLLGRIDPPLWAWTLEASDLLTVARGGVVYGPGRFRRCLGVVLRGRIEVRRESILMAALSAGDVFGAAALFNDSPDYPTTLTALSPCQTLLIPETRVRALLRQCPAFAEDYAAYLSGRIQFLSQRLGAGSSPSSTQMRRWLSRWPSSRMVLGWRSSEHSRQRRLFSGVTPFTRVRRS